MTVHYGSMCIKALTIRYPGGGGDHSFGSQIRLRLHLRASTTLWLLGPPDPRHNGSAPQPDGPAHQEKGEKGQLFSENRNTFHLESLILGSDKVENASHEHLESSGFWRPPHPRMEWQCATSGRPPCANGIQTWTPFIPEIYNIIFIIKDSRQVSFLSLFVLPWSDEKNLSPQKLRKNK